MKTFTSSLPEKLFAHLDEVAKQMAIPKNKIIERALRIYLDQLRRAEYIKSYKTASKDDNLISIAEEGMIEYLTMLKAEDDEAR